jgi:hypothetical protein
VAQEYEQSQAIDATPKEVFAWLSDVDNFPDYLPPVVEASAEGPSTEGIPGQRIRTTLEYPRRRATSPWTRGNAGWSGAQRRAVTTRAG